MSMLRPLRVLLMAGSMELGGSERQTCLLLEHLDRTQFQPHLYLTYRRGELLGKVPVDVPVEAFSDLHFSPKMNWPGRWHGRMVAHLRDLLARWQIDVVYDRTFHMTMIAAPACGRHVGRVSTIVCPPSQDLPNVEKRFVALKRARLASAYRRASRVVAVSDAVRQSALEYYALPAEQVVTLKSPVDIAGLRKAAKVDPPSWFSSTISAEEHGKAETDLQQTKPLNIVCVGRMTREKGQDLLITAASLLRNHSGGRTESGVKRLEKFVVWLVGDGPLRGELEEQTGRLGLSDHVRFVGQVTSPASLVTRCDVLVCPSRYEGLPNVVLEAMALEVPVIASDVGGIPEVVQPGVTGTLVPVEQPQRIAEELAGLFQSTGRYREMAGRARALVQEHFAMPRYLEQLAGILRKAAGAGANRG